MTRRRVRRAAIDRRIVATVLAAAVLSACFGGGPISDTATTSRTLSTVAISVPSPAGSVADPVAEVASTDTVPATPPPTDNGGCTVAIELDGSDPDPAWSDGTDASGLTYGGWFTEEQFAAAQADGTPIDRQQFSLTCIGPGGQGISIVGTNLIPMRAAEYPLRTSPTGGQSARDTVQMQLVTAAADPDQPRNRVWLLADEGLFTITEFDESHVVATIRAPVVALDGTGAGILVADFDFPRS